ncbi:peptide ABC transporter substrate-binding protein [Psittacicella gerlachiana]|uniref:Solute-binding protein family 5 domain-containing protein n=1 Tax=Psittacicella gerlachiana TaxID=2028574 RepID=A0A3A1YKE8_9GAMM|nr:peptide ABC transporter substrate-binding protein [Psittacicella gerlachiana]RIY37946.1 hypothetical protein CKF59_01085 [Psittacicella gerlachiana]
MFKLSLSALGASLMLLTQATLASEINGAKLAPQQELRVAFPASPDTLDPNYLKYSADFRTLRPVFDTISRLNSEGKYVPVAAQSWQVSEDGLTWTFYLRKEAKWQDGKPVTAQDFVYSWQRLTDPNTAAPFGDYLVNANILNGKEIYARELPPSALGVKALDAYTLEVKLTAPVAWLPEMLSTPITAPIRQDLIEKYGEQWTKVEHLVGNGPYKISSYQFNEQMTYTKWDDYWDATNVHLTQIRHDYTKDTNVSYMRYLSGEYLFSEIPSQYLEKVQQERPQEVYKVLAGRTSYLAFNPFRIEPRVRQALSLLTDRKLLTSQVLKAHIPTSAFAFPYLADLEIIEQQDWFKNSQSTNNAQARELLKEAGYTPENPLVITLSQPISNENNKLYVAVANLWKTGSQGAVILKQEALEPVALYAKYPKLDYDFIFATYGMDYPQASTFYNIFLSYSPINNKRWQNPQFDQLLHQANTTIAKEQRQQLYAQAHELLIKDSPFEPLWYPENLILKKPELGGYYTGLALNYYRDMYILDLNTEKNR